MNEKTTQTIRTGLKTAGIVIVAAALGMATLMSTPTMAEAAETPKLTIHKYVLDNTAWRSTAADGTAQTVPSSATPIGNVSFDIYKVTTGMPTDAATVIATPNTYGINLDNPTTTITTTATGEATATLDEATYLVVEQVATGSAPVATSSPFLVRLPMTTPDGTGMNYDVHVYPKSSLTPGIDKTVADGLKHKGVRVGDVVSWKISADLPADLCYTDDDGQYHYATEYKITDTLNPALTLNGTPSVELIGGNGIVMTAGADYSLDITDGTIVFTLSDSGMRLIGDEVLHSTYRGPLPKVVETKAIEITISTTVTDAIVAAGHIENTASLDYTNSGGYKTTTNPTENPEIHVGTAGITKKDSNNNVLADADFKIATSLENANNGVFLQKDGSDWVISSSASTGIVEFTGLPYGDDDVSYDTASSKYYLVEVSAPSGYEKLRSPIEITVSANSANETAANVVVNNKTFELPMTGGPGTAIFIGVGTLLLGTGIVMMLKLRRGKKTDEK